MSKPPAPKVITATQYLGKKVPHNLEAEMALVGSVILDYKMIDEVAGVVTDADFYDPLYAGIYAACVKVASTSGAGLDLITLLAECRERGLDRHVAANSSIEEQLSACASAVPTAANAVAYAKIIAAAAWRRRIIDAATLTLEDAYNPDGAGLDDAREIYDRMAERAREANRDERAADSDLAALLDAELKRLDEERPHDFVATGWPALNQQLGGGLSPCEMIVVAARPSMGKSAFAVNICEAVAARGEMVGLFSLEMDRASLVRRMVASQAGVDAGALRAGRLDDDQIRRVMIAAGRMREWPFTIEDKPGLTVSQIRIRARRMVDDGARLIVIDYLQLVAGAGRAENRQVEVAGMSRGIKDLARELKVPVVILAQLNRQNESRADQRPRMADLRESGAIEQDADVIMLLHREEYYHAADPEWRAANPNKAGLAEIIVAKQRNGPTGVVELRWDANRTRFEPMERVPVPARKWQNPTPFD